MRMNARPWRGLVLIPCYNHGSTLATVIEGVRPLGLPVLVVDDGSDAETRLAVERAADPGNGVHVLHLPQNGGKGAACMAGFKWAHEHGFTHALQVDADGQHDLEAARGLLALSREHPEDLVSGRPVYDESVPKKRLIGRYVTHFWVWVETWSLVIKDSLCGFRVYPVEEALAAARSGRIGRRMDFDPEIMVRMYWRGCNVHFLPTRVIYPEGGISHFDMVVDNIRIARMHTGLFFESLVKAPARLFRRRRRHWSEMRERRSPRGMLGFKILCAVHRIGGRALFRAGLALVVLGMWATGGAQRRASRTFLRRVEERRRELGMTPSHVGSLTQFMTFGESILDRILAWKGELTIVGDIAVADETTRRTLFSGADGRGRLILVSHLGVIDASRAVCEREGLRKINVLVFDKHAPAFKAMMEELAPDSRMNIIPVDAIGMDTAIMLREAVDRGEWVAIAADRAPVGSGAEVRVVEADFLGRPAPFPIGPYVLAQVLECPVITMFVVHEDGRLVLKAEPFADSLPKVPSRERELRYREWAGRYAERLGREAVEHPADWFNFYDFWHEEKPLPGDNR